MFPIVVQKYGGTSLGSPERFQRVSERIHQRVQQGQSLVVVVSAMGGETDRLFELAKAIGATEESREVDALLATGEQVSAALLCLALHHRGVPSISLRAPQIPIRTNRRFGNALIEFIDPKKIVHHLSEKKVVVVTGFQGVTEDGDTTTLGRGGSDLTAVALAAALDAQQCEIYTDVCGVFSSDPHICHEARPIRKISHDEMLEIASLGAKVLQPRSVRLAKRYLIPVWIGSSFEEKEGTWVTREEEGMESSVVSGISCDRKEAKISIRNLPDQMESLSQVFQAISKEKINVDVIVQDQTEDGRTHLSFTVPRDSLPKALNCLEKISKQFSEVRIHSQEKVAKVSAVGIGMRAHFGVASRMFSCLSKERIEVFAVSTSEIKISCVIHDRYAELAVRALHEEFGLAKEPN